MKRMASAVVAVTIVLLILPSVATAQVPGQMKYQGYLSDSEGAPLDTSIEMTFTIYDDSIGKGAWWSETQMVEVISGLFHVPLGAINAIPDTVMGAPVDPHRFLGIQVGSDQEIYPRTRLLSVPYAFRVASINGASGGDVFGDLRLHSTLTVGEYGGDAGRIEVTDGTSPVIVADGASGDLAVTGRLQVESSDLHSGHFTSDNPSASTQVVHSEFTGTGGYDAQAVYGRSAPEDFYGYGGYFEGGFMGVHGEVSPTGAEAYTGVYGTVSGGAGSNWNMGVQGSATGPATNVGVQALGYGGEENYGVWGHTDADGKCTNYGIYGSAGNSGTNWAGYFAGDVRVTGAISKGCGGFWIDHPLDPEKRYLYHSFVESPDMKNIYDGVVMLDADGGAVVELPDYFETVNMDFRYQLTCIGGYVPVYIAKEMSGNRFVIAGGKPGMKISWQVTGIRRDPFAEANRIEVEVDKPAQEQGKYLHPQAYGLGEEHGINYERHQRMLQAVQQKGDGKIERR
jgi:hypothetical protein